MSLDEAFRVLREYFGPACAHRNPAIYFPWPCPDCLRRPPSSLRARQRGKRWFDGPPDDMESIVRKAEHWLNETPAWGLCGHANATPIRGYRGDWPGYSCPDCGDVFEVPPQPGSVVYTGRFILSEPGPEPE